MQKHLPFLITLFLVFLMFYGFIWKFMDQINLNLSFFAFEPRHKFENDTQPGDVIKAYGDDAHESDLEKRLDASLQKAADGEVFNILIWDPMFGQKSKFSVEKQRCGSCVITYNKSKVTDLNTKAVVFHFIENQRYPKPKERRRDQYYVWWAKESTATLIHRGSYSLKEYNNYFNLTMTYRQDSDVISPYGTTTDLLLSLQRDITATNQSIFDLTDELVKKKKKLVLWVVSNCGSTKGAIIRMKIVKALIKEGLKVDLGGRCFPNGVKDWKFEDYKFYLAFENSFFCKDYITEKFFRNALSHGAVPVVLGAKKSDYERNAPPKSFIFADDFSIKELIDYLNYLNNNDSAYKEYFYWREIPLNKHPEHRRATGYCQMCRILHGINFDNIFNPNYNQSLSHIPLFEYYNRSRIVPSLADWVYGKENKECLKIAKALDIPDGTLQHININ